MIISIQWIENLSINHKETDQWLEVEKESAFARKNSSRICGFLPVTLQIALAGWRGSEYISLSQLDYARKLMDSIFPAITRNRLHRGMLARIL
jgi:hypothetical protein